MLKFYQVNKISSRTCILADRQTCPCNLVSHLVSFFLRSSFQTIYIKLKGIFTEPRKGHFFSNIYQKRSWNKENWKSISVFIGPYLSLYRAVSQSTPVTPKKPTRRGTTNAASGIIVNVVLVRNHETLWKSIDTRFSLGTVLPSGYNTPWIKFSLRNTKLGAVSTTNAEPINLYSVILS